MPRFRLAEFEDQKWFPGSIRAYMVDYLRFMSHLTGIYRPAFRILKKLVEETGEQDVLELCSGGGGPSEIMMRELKGIINSLTLTDLYPNLDSFRYLAEKNADIRYLSEPVDAREVVDELKGIRLMFSAIHHFEPEDVKKIFHNAEKSTYPVAFFEAADRKFIHLLAILFFTPVFFFIFTPFIKPFRFSRLFFTYILPLVPFFTTYDGVISIMRMYKAEELLILANQSAPSYLWSAGREGKGIRQVTFITGRKKLN